MPIKRFRKGTYNSYFKRKMSRRGKYGRRRTQSFKARVNRVLMRKAETKSYNFAEENVQLYHNVGYSTAAPTGKTFPIFFNIWAVIDKGTSRFNRIGDRISPCGMSLKIWIANKLDRPNLHYRVIIARIPKAINGVAVTSSYVDFWDADNLGSMGNKLLLRPDKDRGIKMLYDKIWKNEMGLNCLISGTNKECHMTRKIWLKSKKSRDIQYDSTTSNQIVNNPVVMTIIPYDSFGTLTTDNVASCAYYGTLYYKDV